MLTTVGEPLSRTEAAELLDDMDINSDGEITREEFLIVLGDENRVQLEDGKPLSFEIPVEHFDLD